MRKLTIVAATLALLAGSAVAQIGLSHAADHDDRAVRRRRPDRHRGAAGRRADDRDARPAGHRRERRRRGRHARRRRESPRPIRTATRCCCTTSAWRPARALPQAALRPGDGLRPDRPDHRRADDRRRARPTSRPSSIGELLDYIQANKDKVIFAHAGVGAGLAPVRPAADGGAGHADDHRCATRAAGRR